MVYSTKPFTCYFTFAALQSLPENDLMRLSQFVQEQAAVYRTVVERNSMLVFKIHNLRKIWVSGDETAGHSFAAVCKELPNPVVELLELIGVAKTDAVFRIEEYRRTAPLLDRIRASGFSRKLLDVSFRKISGGKGDVVEHARRMRIYLCVLDRFR